MYNINSTNERGVRAPKEWFTGTVWLTMNLLPDEGYDANAGTVTFETKARTNWHSHTCGQILFVIEGVGYYQEKGKPIQVIKKGDVVKIPKKVVHWHGASHISEMRHIALITDYEKDTTEWFDPVSDDDYNKISLAGPKIDYLSDTAIRVHQQLWGNSRSKLQETDPELIRVFDNFAFDEVLKNSTLDTKLRVLLIMASTIASQSLTEYKAFVNAALNVGVTPIEIKEVLYQSVPYVGISKVVDFIYTTNQIFEEKGITLPIDNQSTTTPETRSDKGYKIQKDIFGAGIDDMYANSPKDLLHIQHFLSANCFGDYVTRNGLDAKIRELVTLSFLIALGGTESQIKGHIRGNANVGNNRQTLIDAITQLLPYVGYPRTLNAIGCLNEILPEG